MPSFDVVSEVDLQEVENAVNQSRKEVEQRYDFKGSDTKIEWDKEAAVEIESADEFKVRAAADVLRGRLAKRQIAMKAIDEGKIETAPGGRAAQTIRFKQGIDADRAKKLQKTIRDLKIKVQPQVQGDQLRVSGKKRDDLQQVIAALKQADVDIPLQFTNFRD